MYYFLFCIPIIASAVVWMFNNNSQLRKLYFLASTLILIFAIMITVPLLAPGVAFFESGFWYLDRFAALMILAVSVIQWTAMLASLPYLQHELDEAVITIKMIKLYISMFFLFVLSMLLTISSNNIGIMWVTIEGTTLATTMLVAFYTKEGSLEAAWKYIVLCPLGIMLGFLGILLIYYAAVNSGMTQSTGLTWTTLHNMSGSFSSVLMKLGFICVFLGFGTKVGLVPMHAWLPDAHSRAPSPISAMLSGVLLSVALFCVIRFKVLVDTTLGFSDWSNNLFFIFGAISFVVPAFFLVKQSNYKRMLAYSSIEHMGFIVFAMSFGTAGIAAGLIHLLGHAFAKSMLFYGAGNILLKWKTTKIPNIKGVFNSLPYTAGLFTIGLFLLLGTPPSPLFTSELLTIGISFQDHPVVVGLMLFAGVVIFGSMLANTTAMFLAPHGESVEQNTLANKEHLNLSHLAMALHLIILVGLGLVIINGVAFTWFQSLAATII